MWVGYVSNHVVRVHHMWNPVTNKIILPQDVMFLHKSYGNWIKEKEYHANQVTKTPVSMLKNIGNEDSGDNGTVMRSRLVRRVGSPDSESSNQET